MAREFRASFGFFQGRPGYTSDASWAWCELSQFYLNMTMCIANCVAGDRYLARFQGGLLRGTNFLDRRAAASRFPQNGHRH